MLGVVQQAVVDGRRAMLEYVAANGTSTRRVVDPLGLALKGSVWYLLAGTEKGQRTFRVDRMRSIDMTQELVERPEDFDLADAWRQVAAEIDERRAPIRAAGLARKEELSFFRYLFGKRVLIGGSSADGRVEVELRGASARSLAGEIAGLGVAVEVIEPPEVREVLARIAEELSGLYRPSGPGSGRKERIGEVTVVSDLRTVRRLWRVFEPYHAITYFSPETTAAFKAVGLRGFWMGYFAGRAAPMGQVGSGLVTATFYNFAPRMVSRSIPDAWGFASPADVLDARISGVDEVLRRVLGDRISSPDMTELAGIAEDAVAATQIAGRPIFAANAQLIPPEEPHLRLWWGVTCLREHRGDGHVAALVQAGIDGCEAHITLVATGALSRAVLQPNRGWTDEEWSNATERVRARGWLEEDGTTLAGWQGGKTASGERHGPTRIGTVAPYRFDTF